MPTKQHPADQHLTTLTATGDRRRKQGHLTAAALWSLAQRAASTEAGGERWTPEDREQIAAEVVERTLRAVANEQGPIKVDRRRRRKVRRATPYQRALAAVRFADEPPPSDRWRSGICRADSPLVSFKRLARIAKDRRESMQADRKHTAPLAAAGDPTGWVGVRITGTGTRDEAERIAADFIARTGLDPDSTRHRALAWKFARDLPEANEARRGTLSHEDAAAELELTPAAYRQNIHRAERDVRKLYPNPTELLAAVVGHRPVERVDRAAITADALAAALTADPPLPVPTMLDYAADPAEPWPAQIRGPLDTAPHRHAPEWREGTDGGERIKPPADLAAARARCRVRARTVAEGGTGRIDRRRAKQRSAADRYAARRALAAAHRSEALHRDGSRKQRTAARDPRSL